jgi:hypothetical protein
LLHIRTAVVFLVTSALAAVVLSNSGSQVAFGPLAGLGVAVLWDVFEDGWRRRDWAQLSLGMWLLIPLAPAPYPHLPAKYLVAAAPAAALLVARVSTEGVGRRPRLAVLAVCVLGVSLGVAILRADTAFSELGRRAAVELIAPSIRAGHRVWFSGHWGFHWYAEMAGARALTVSPPYPEVGDYVVLSARSAPSLKVMQMLERYPAATQIGHIESAPVSGRVMDCELGAGFYSNTCGLLPWYWGGGLLDQFDLWRLDLGPSVEPVAR